MQWTTLAATSLGALIAMGSSFLVELRKDRRETFAEFRRGRRELYGAYLSKLAKTRGDLALLALNRSLETAERVVRARQAFDGCYELRYQLEVFAPRAVVERALVYFRSVRALRDATAVGMEEGEEEYEQTFREVMRALAELRTVMRQDMGTDTLAGG
ncbi:hypothetical protein AB0J21_06360 [Streptomyces sp. NPDC049954]|uniref:hypothetical protein n=1 Tax=Streptomyces sp. NPDC049954 TaxID=3155779 RepID=UPI0034268B54